DLGSGALAVELHVGDPEDHQLLAMALLDPPARLRAVPERGDRVATLVPADLGLDGGAGHDGTADRRLVAVGDEQDPVERDAVAGRGLEQFDFELGADLDAILLAAGLDDCVHGTLRSGVTVVVRPRQRTWRSAGLARGANAKCTVERRRASIGGRAHGAGMAARVRTHR